MPTTFPTTSPFYPQPDEAEGGVPSAVGPVSPTYLLREPTTEDIYSVQTPFVECYDVVHLSLSFLSLQEAHGCRGINKLWFNAATEILEGRKGAIRDFVRVHNEQLLNSAGSKQYDRVFMLWGVGTPLLVAWLPWAYGPAMYPEFPWNVSFSTFDILLGVGGAPYAVSLFGGIGYFWWNQWYRKSGCCFFAVLVFNQIIWLWLFLGYLFSGRFQDHVPSGLRFAGFMFSHFTLLLPVGYMLTWVATFKAWLGAGAELAERLIRDPFGEEGEEPEDGEAEFVVVEANSNEDEGDGEEEPVQQVLQVISSSATDDHGNGEGDLQEEEEEEESNVDEGDDDSDYVSLESDEWYRNPTSLDVKAITSAFCSVLLAFYAGRQRRLSIEEVWELMEERDEAQRQLDEWRHDRNQSRSDDNEHSYPTGLCSTPQHHAAQGTFENQTTNSVDIIWVDFAGGEVHYRTLAPSESYQQSTYDTHPWIARDSGSGTLLYINGKSHEYVTQDGDRCVVSSSSSDDDSDGDEEEEEEETEEEEGEDDVSE